LAAIANGVISRHFHVDTPRRACQSDGGGGGGVEKPFLYY